MMSLADAQALLLSLAHQPSVKHEPLVQCRGRWLSEPLIARRTQPWSDLSAMDGYALGKGDGPWRVIREVPAESRDPGNLAAGEAARIFTGAPVPHGADRILIQENAQRDGDSLTATTALPPSGRHIRTRGSDFADGATLAPAGAAITPALIALAALAGHGSLPVHQRITAGIIVTGSELVEPGSDAIGLPSSNGPMLAAMLGTQAHVTADYRGIVRDDQPALMDAIRRFESEASAPSLLLLSGGASVGDHDLVHPALKAAGWSIAVHKVALKPGKPVMFATKDKHIAIGLPGNPVSAFVTCQLFALPLLRHMGGCPSPMPKEQDRVLAAPTPATAGREEFLRFRFTADGRILPLQQQDSGALAALAEADGLIRIPAHTQPQDAGASVRIITVSITMPMTAAICASETARRKLSSVTMTPLD